MLKTSLKTIHIHLILTQTIKYGNFFNDRMNSRTNKIRYLHLLNNRYKYLIFIIYNL